MDSKDLKIQALKERIGALTVDYEDKIADLRVAITSLTNENSQLRTVLNEMTTGKQEVVEGESEVVEEEPV